MRSYFRRGGWGKNLPWRSMVSSVGVEWGLQSHICMGRSELGRIWRQTFSRRTFDLIIFARTSFPCIAQLSYGIREEQHGWETDLLVVNAPICFTVKKGQFLNCIHIKMKLF